MASGTKNKGAKGKRGKGNDAVKAARAASGAVNRKQIPWLTVLGVVVILGLAGTVFGYYLVKSEPKREQKEREEAAAEVFTPKADNQDPSKKIEGIVIEEYKHRGHVNAPERVAYDQNPPFGGPHDSVWAECTGTVYDVPVRNENMIHSLEHGTVWIAYNPDKLDDAAIEKLALRVENKPFTMLSPYPGLDEPISLQSWGHQLKLSDPDDQRIDNFIAALRSNQYLTPEPGATCQSQYFDTANPPEFDASKPGKDAKPLDFDGNAGSGMGSGGVAPEQGGEAPADNE